MSQKFFASVRRNQKQWMVVVTVLSMVSFLFLDDFGRGKGPMSPLGGGLMIGCLVAAGLSIVGYPRGKTTEFGVGGLIVGFLAGFIGFGAVGANKPIARTAIGSFSRSDFQKLASERQKVNKFVFALARKVQNPQVQGFGHYDDPSIMSYQLLLADAKKMGIHVSDKRVNDYLHQISQGKMSKQDFKDSLRDALLGEGELFEFLKKELSAQLVAELMIPPAFTPQIPQGFERYVQESTRCLQQTPFQLWDEFQKLNLKESLQAVAIPVADFASKAPDPSETELTAFFEMFKGQRWIDEARPGFAKLPRVQLAYLTGDFEKFEKGEEVTDADISGYYEKHKDRYRVLPTDESAKKDAPATDATATESKPADAPKADEAVKTPEVKPESAPATEKPADQPAVPAAEKPAEPAADKPATDGDKSKCGDDEPSKPAAEKPAEPKPADAKPEETAKPEAAADPKPAEAAKPEAPAETKVDPKPTSEEKPAADASIPSLNSSPESLPAPKYRELNDELKLEIRDAVLRERAFAKISTELDKAYDLMVRLGLDYDSTTDASQKPEKAKTIGEQLREYAQAHKLEYKETKDLTFEELSAEAIGGSLEGKGRTPVANEAFMTAGRGEARMPLYAPHRSETKPQTEAFAYWKIAEFPAQASDLKDEAVRAKVVSAWKFDQARKLAEARTKELLEKVKQQGNDMPAALGTEPITGAEGSPVFKIIETQEFSWMSAGQAMPGQSQNPMISTIPNIDNIGDRFMRTVFEELNDGEVGMVVDEPRAVFYLVKVVNRELAKDDGGVAKQERQQKFLKEEFASRLFPIIKSPYQSFAQFYQQQIDQAWQRSFQQQHSVTWEGTAQEDSEMQ